jgi:hypothetical protein
MRAIKVLTQRALERLRAPLDELSKYATRE